MMTKTNLKQIPQILGGLMLLTSSAMASSSPAQFYAPAPLNLTQVPAQSVEIPRFIPGQGLDWNSPLIYQMPEADLEEITRQFLGLVQETSLPRQRLIDAITARVSNIYTSPDSTDDLTEAKKFYSERLKSDLGFAYHQEAEILRAAPIKPVLSHTQISPSEEGENLTLEGLRFFDLKLNFSRPELQDDLYLEVFNPNLPSRTVSSGSPSDLYTRLTQFQVLYPEIQQNLNGENAAQARKALLELFENAATAYEHLSSQPAPEPLRREITQGVVLREHQAKDGTFVAELILKEISATELEFEGYQQTQISENFYHYVDSTGKLLSWGEARMLPRTIRLLKMDSIKTPHFSLRTWIVRNERIKNGDAAVSSQFVFQSSETRLGTELTPQLRYDQEIDLGKGEDQKHELDFYLAKLFQSLGGVPNGAPLEVSLNVSGVSQNFKIPLILASHLDARSLEISEISRAITEAARQVDPANPITRLEFQMQVFLGGANPLISLSNVILDPALHRLGP